MPRHHDTTEFLAPKPADELAGLKNAVSALEAKSSEFVSAWTAADRVTAERVSREAGSLIDLVINLSLRLRDELKADPANRNHPYLLGLRVTVGRLVEPFDAASHQVYQQMAEGNACIPSTCITGNLSLSDALNKLKHCVREELGFRVTGTSHFLLSNSLGGAGRSDSLSEIDFALFINALKQALASV